MSGNRSRAQLLADLRRVGREHSDATVLFFSAAASEAGLHPTDYKALGVLDRLGPMSAGELGRHTGLAPASVTNLIDRLVAKGFLRREPDPLDRRRALLHADVAVLADNEFFASWQRTATQLWERYSDTDLAVILDFLADTAERLRTRTEALASGGIRGARREQHLREAGLSASGRSPSTHPVPRDQNGDHD
jgi:DNA-binding Lrp family transcriptional regulator